MGDRRRTKTHWIGCHLALIALLLVPGATLRAEETAQGAAAANKEQELLLATKRIADSTAKPAPLRVLVIGAHPADVFDQSGGTMAHHTSRGDWVGCIVVTAGTRVHDKVIADEMQHKKEIPKADELKRLMSERAQVKEKEVIHACSILGVHEPDVYFLGGNDMPLLVNEKMIQKLAAMIRKLRPDVVLTHFPYEEAGLDGHAVTGQMAVLGMKLAASVDPDDQTPPHKVTQAFFFGQGSSGPRANLWASQGGYYNDILVDISDVVEKKIACLDAMESQGYAGAYARKRIETSDGAFGAKVRVPYAEGFISLYSTTQYYLPVSEISRQHAKASDHEGIQRRSYRVNVP